MKASVYGGVEVGACTSLTAGVSCATCTRAFISVGVMVKG